MDSQNPHSEDQLPISKRLKLSTTSAAASTTTSATTTSATTTTTTTATSAAITTTLSSDAATTVTSDAAAATTVTSDATTTTAIALTSTSTTAAADTTTTSTTTAPITTTTASFPNSEDIAAAISITSADATITDVPDTSATTAAIRRPPTYRRRKVAIFFAYCGVGYQGMQKNPGAKTIEGDLEEALYRSGAVPEAERGRPGKYEWARSARTDKGVSAVGQVASGRFIVDPAGFIDRMNSNLVDQIRIFGYKRVAGSFNAQKFCDRRRYVYLIPVFALDPMSHVVLGSSGNEVCLECSKMGRNVIGITGKGCSGVGDKLEDLKDGEYEHEGEGGGLDGNGEVVEVKKREFCYGDKERERFNRVLKYYVGTHNFHNFTSRITAQDPSAKRYIMSFNANETVNVDGIEFVKCEVVGQSFLLHQIRKMIGLAVVIMRDTAPEEMIERAFRKDVKINVPVAPEVGLYLDECFFNPYNKKWKDSHEEVSMNAYTEEAEAFKMKYIYPHIGSTEHKDGTVALWLHYLNHRNYPDLRIGACTSEENAKPQDLLVRNNDGSSSAMKSEVANPCIGTNGSSGGNSDPENIVAKHIHVGSDGNNNFQNAEDKDIHL